MTIQKTISAFVISGIVVYGITSIGYAASFPTADWKACVISPQQKAKLDRFKSKVKGTGVIVKDGCLLAQWGAYKTPIDWASASKPLVSLLLLRAVQQNKIRSVDDPVSSVVAKRFGKPLVAKDASMTWAHLADMVSGYARGEAPGDRWAYNDYAISLYRHLIESVYGTSMDKAFSPFKRALRFQDGAKFAANKKHRWQASPRDMARVGWLFLNRGKWGSRQIVPAIYWSRYFKPQVHHGTRQSTKSGSDYLRVGTTGGGSSQTSMGPGHYGFNLWFNKGTSGKRFWPSAPDDAYQFNGHWGKEVMTVLPGCNAVAAVKGAWGKMQPGISSGMNVTMDLLKQAVCY